MIDLEDKYIQEINKTIFFYIPDCEIRLFGSRLNGKARKSSDVDIAIVGKEKLDWRLLEKIKTAFSESDIPYVVDVSDWHALTPDFQKLIEKKYEVL